MSANRAIKPREQQCISECIKRYWGDRDNPVDPEARDQSYEQCLTDCRICG